MEIFKYSQFEALSSSTPEDHNNDLSADKKSFPCTFPGCGKIFKFKSEIKRHNVIHYENRPFPCPHEGCKKTFKRADALETHMRLHTKDSPFECDFPDCDKKFTTKAALKYHVLKHKQERSFKCTFPGCDKSFFTKGQLKQHERAFNYHVNLTVTKVKDDTNKGAVSIGKDKDSFKEFYAPEPRLVQNTEWEIKNLGLEDDFVNKEEPQSTSFGTIVKYVFKENSVTNDKIDKLELTSPILDSFQDEDQLDKLVFGQDKGQEWLQPVQEPSLFFDPNEFQILDFLKEQAYDDYWNTDFTSAV